MEKATILAGLILTLVVGQNWAQEGVSLQRADSQFFSPEPHFAVTCRLTIDDGTGDPKTRTLALWSARSTPENRLLVQVTSPSSLKNLKFLRVETPSGTGAWLKTSRGVQRLPPAADPEPLFGSDFTTADFLPGPGNWTPMESPESNTLVLERATDARIGWTKEVITLRRADRLMLRSDFFDSSGVLVRSYRVLEFSDQGLPKIATMEDKRSRRSSTLEVLSYDPKSTLSAGLFSPGNL